MGIRAYVINLDRSPERLAVVEADAAAAGIDLIRVAGVDGKTVPPQDRDLLDYAGFLRDHGKHPMAGEYGCYASHIVALEAFLESGAPHALILEDDVKIPPDVIPLVEEIASLDDWDVVKLVHHRMRSLRVDRRLSGGRRFGRAKFGPTGSAAAYLVNRKGAERLVGCLVPMRLPYDIAFERGWACGVRVRHVRPDVFSFNQASPKSLTREGASYADMKLPAWRRLPTLRFRVIDLVRRFACAMVKS